jgi:ubiquinone/menaquinone biosynthesis C-methylase UbiE
MTNVDVESDARKISYNDSIISQFTKQAVPFVQMSQHSNQYGLNLILKLSGPKHDDTVLDVTRGPGLVSCEFAKIVGHVAGIDLPPAMIEQAKRLQKEKDLRNIDWRIGDVYDLPFEDNSFSLVLTRYSLHHMINPKAVIKEMSRVCKPEGRILIVDVTPPEDKKKAYNHAEKLRDPSHTEALTLIELQDMVETIGLCNIRIESQDLEMNLESILTSSFSNPEDKDKINLLFKKRHFRR